MKLKLTYLSFAMMFHMVLCGNSYAAPKITQAAVIGMGNNDVADVISVEEFEEHFKLLVVGENKKILFSSEFGIGEAVEGYSPLNPFLRFKSYTIQNLPSPLILAVLEMPAFNNHFSEIRLIAEVNGKFSVINPAELGKELILSSHDGIYIGYINKKYGNGLIIGEYILKNGGKNGPHRYSISIFNWDKKKSKFSLSRRFVTKHEFSNFCSALKSNRLACRNIRDDIIQVGNDVSTLGLEPVLLQNTDNAPGNIP